MASSESARKRLDAEFLGIRCRLLELAAAFDRIDRAAEGPGCRSAATDPADPRMAQIRRSLGILADDAFDRAERVQRTFSLEEGRV
ncbi:MAG: hypothetical protein ABFC63_08010 [Thermoguttaceae bacterium]